MSKRNKLFVWWCKGCAEHSHGKKNMELHKIVCPDHDLRLYKFRIGMVRKVN